MKEETSGARCQQDGKYTKSVCGNYYLLGTGFEFRIEFFELMHKQRPAWVAEEQEWSEYLPMAAADFPLALVFARTRTQPRMTHERLNSAW